MNLSNQQSFSTFTTPIIIQSMLWDFNNVFCQMLPVQYHTHWTMMGKRVNLSPDVALTDDQRRKEQLHDRFVLFDFMYLTRARNKNYFYWMAVVNAALQYSGTRDHILIHFGYSVTQSSLIQKLGSLYSFPDLVNKTTATLQQFKSFVIAVFDNSQVNNSIKHQWNSSCANMAIATCRLYVKPKIHDYIEDMDILDNEEIEITYLDQIIPSPYGMPKFKMVHWWCQQEMESETCYKFELSIDTTGARVNAYYSICQIISVSRRCKWAFPYVIESQYSYSNPEHNESLQIMKVCKKICANYQPAYETEKEGVHCSWCHQIWKMLYHYTSTWRGEMPPAQLLIPPVSPKNKTTNKGVANMIKAWWKQTQMRTPMVTQRILCSQRTMTKDS